MLCDVVPDSHGLPAVVEATKVKRTRWTGTGLGIGWAGLMALAVLGIAGLEVRAQSSNGELSGVITDTSGAVVAGAEVKALNTATNVTYSGISNGSGLYLLPELLP